MWKKIKNNRGYSMIEGIMATTVFGVGLLGGLGVMQNTLVKSTQSELHVEAVSLAQEKIEDILADKEFKGYDYVSNTLNYPEEELDDKFVRNVSVSEVNPDDLGSSSPGSGYNKVTVEVSWGNADSQNVSLSTLVTR